MVVTTNLRNGSTITWPEVVAETHVHLGGSVPLHRLWEIAIERGIRGIGTEYDEFVELLQIKTDRVRDLDSYLEVFDRVELIQSGPTAVRESVVIAVHRAQRTGGMRHLGPGGEGGLDRLFKIGRLELRFNPLKRTGAVFLKGSHAGLYDVDRIILAACDALEELHVGFRGAIECGLIFCFGRDMTFEANMVLARKTAEWRKRNKLIVGVDLAGHESINSLASPKQLQEMKEIFDAVGADCPRTVHVGETRHVDIETFIATIEALNPQRVAHPITAFRAFSEDHDDRGLKLLKERDITCELCVQSNLLTHAVRSLEEYGRMLRTFDDFGISYCFSTDSPSLQVTSLANELMLLLESGAATTEQVLQALQIGWDRSFLQAPGRAA